MKHVIDRETSTVEAATPGRRRVIAALQVFAGGACYGAMATTYKLAYAAGFTSAQVVASQAWFGCLFFVIAAALRCVRSKRLRRIGPAKEFRSREGTRWGGRTA